MRLGDQLMRLADDFGVPGRDVSEIHADPTGVTFIYWATDADGHRYTGPGGAVARAAKRVHIDAEPSPDAGVPMDPDAPAPIFEQLRAERYLTTTASGKPYRSQKVLRAVAERFVQGHNFAQGGFVRDEGDDDA